MQNPLYSLPYNNHSLLNQFHNSQEDMEDHFNQLLGQSTSRYTAAQTQIITTNNQQTFHSSRMFVIGTLESWGMKIGTLQYSKDNELTIKCLLELISQKQRDIQQKIKVKDQFTAVNFEKQKYQSFLKQTKNSLNEKDKQLGKLENQSTQLKKKIKLIENQSKKEKIDDQKIIFMLKSKNQQILHQIKKKQAEVNRVKQQMKRNVLSKSTTSTKTQNGINPNINTVKNSFELIEKIDRLNSVKQSKWKKNATQRNMNQNYAQNFEEEKFAFMLEKYEKEKKVIVNENTLLRGKVFEIREVLVKFAEWIDVELFGQTLQKTRKMLEKKFICNHNLLFSQDALVNDLVEIVNEAKQGIQQLQERLQETQGYVSSQKSLESPLKKNNKASLNGKSSKSINFQGNMMFKKKSVSIRETGTPVKSSPLNVKSQKAIISGAESQKEIKTQKKQPYQRVSQQHQMRKAMIKPQQIKSPQISKPIFKGQQYGTLSMPSQIRPSKSSFINELQFSVFENDILSDIYEQSVSEDPDHSIVSHISASEFVKEMEKENNKKYNRWDILFHTEGDEENQQEEE